MELSSVDAQQDLAHLNLVQTQILAEHYLRKGNLSHSLNIFQDLASQNPTHYAHHYYAGKICFQLGQMDKALDHLERARSINPLHRQTLLLIHHVYERKKYYEKAFECLLDLYVLAKDIKDQDILYYETRIRSVSEKIKNFSPEKKQARLKERLDFLRAFFIQLENQLPHVASQDEASSFSPPDSSEKQDDAMTYVQSFVPEQTLVEPSAKTLLAIQEAQAKENAALDQDLQNPSEQAPLIESLQDADPDRVETDDAPSASTHNIAHALERVGLLRQVTRAKMDKIEHFTSQLTFEDGDIIFKEQDPVFGFHILVEGDVALCNGVSKIQHYSAPCIIDEDDFVSANYRSYSLISKGASQLLFFNKAGYQNFDQNDPNTIVSILWRFSKSLSLKIHGIIEQILSHTSNQGDIQALNMIQEFSKQRELKPEDVTFMSSIFDAQDYKKGDRLFSGKDERTFFYLVIDGNVTCSTDGIDPVNIQSNEYLSAFLFCGPGSTHNMTCEVASETAQIIPISHKQLSSFSQFDDAEQRQLADFILRILAQKCKEVRKLLLDIIEAQS